METAFRSSTRSVVIVLSLVLIASFALGQGIVTGSIGGAVQDPQGAVVTGAKVVAKDAGTNREFKGQTSAAGIFAVRLLPPGSYTVRIESGEFRAYEATNVVVAVGTETSLGTIKMSLGSRSETVTVEGGAPLVEGTTDQLSQSFTTEQTASLPIGNNFDSLALFVPGVAPAGDAGFSNTNGAGIVSNGMRGRSNNFEIDGQGNNDSSIGGPSIFFGNQDAIGEIQIITNYSAEYGKNAGSVVNYITKGGTNQFHGTGFEFWQGSHFDSLANQEKSALFSGANGNPFCQKGQNPKTDSCDPTVVPRYVENRFGGSVGGPIVKDRAWFFGSTNYDRVRSAGAPSSTGTGFTPTPNGITQLQTAFPGNPGVAALVAIGPTAIKAGNPVYGNLTSGTAKLISVSDGNTSAMVEFSPVTRFVPALFNDREYTGRVDLKATEKDNVFARYVFQDTINTGVNFGLGLANGDWETVPGRDQQVGFDWARNFSNTFINQVRVSYSRANFGFNSGATPACVQTSPLNCPTQVTFTSPGGIDANFGLASGFPQGRIANVYSVQDNASVSRGLHTLKFGGEFDRQNSPNVFLPNSNGTFRFSSFNNLLANKPSRTRIALGNPTLPFTENDLAFYFQDDWRVRQNLTVNLGMRWEWNQQAVNLLHDRTLAQQTGPKPFWDTTLPLSLTTVPKIPQAFHNFSPVLGFAWTPKVSNKLMGDNQTVLRGGFRVAYDPSFYNMFLNVATSSPTVNTQTFTIRTTGFVPGLPTSGGFLGTNIQAVISPFVPTGAGINPGFRTQTTVAKNFHNPYTEQWNLGIQRSIGSRVALEARYVGNHAVGLFQTADGNPALGNLIANGFQNLIPAGLTPCSDSTQPGFVLGNVDCNRRQVVSRGNTAYSNYNSLQTELRIAHWHGVSGSAAYTWSKTIDNASEVYSTIAGGSTVSFSQNPFDTSRAERARSGIDYPHILGVVFTYDLPFYKSQQGLLGHLAGGWEMNTTYRYTSGQPYTTIQFADNGSAGICDPGGALSVTYDACRPILSNKAARLDTVGFCTDPTLSDCGISDFVTGNPTTLSAVHWVFNDPTAAAFYGTPFKGAGRNILRGQAVNTVNLGMFKDTNIGERLKLQFQAQAFNLTNTQFLGNPDPILDDVGSSFQNTHFNTNGGSTSTANATYDGIGRRRLLFGLKLIF